MALFLDLSSAWLMQVPIFPSQKEMLGLSTCQRGQTHTSVLFTSCAPRNRQGLERGGRKPRRISKLWALRLVSKVEFPENTLRFPACMPLQSSTTQRGRTGSPCWPSDPPSKTRNQVPVQKVLRGWRTLTVTRNELLNYCWLNLCLSEPMDLCMKRKAHEGEPLMTCQKLLIKSAWSNLLFLHQPV